MEFEQKKRYNKNEMNYHIENLRMAREFSKGILTEMNELVRSIVIFGSNTSNTQKKDSDIDIMIILDNISVFVSDELREAYRVISAKLNREHADNKIHLMTINLSDLWDMARKGDPILINILRHGLPLFDRDLIEPLQYLLEIGRIKPSRETIDNYMARSSTLLEESKNHLISATLDLYYAVVDMVHAVLIINNVLPPSPKEMPALYKRVFKGNKELLLHTDLIEEIYKIYKDIEHRKSGMIDARQFEILRKKSESLITALEKYAKKELEKKDPFSF